jgi:predicted PurR-regulated permease PerM
MPNKKPIDRPATFEGVSPTLRAWGLRSWFFVGIALAAMTFVVFFTTIASVSVPFVIAVVMAMIFHPLVDLLERHRVNRSIGSILVLLLVTAVIIFTGWLVWTGVYSNSDQIAAQIEAGLAALGNLILNVLPDNVAQQVIQKALSAMPQMLSGVGSAVFSGFSSIFAVIMGVYVAFFLLYYLLADWHNLSEWVGRHLGVSDELGVEIANDSTSAVRTYFYALTLANIPVAASVGLTMWLLGLPLAIPVAIVTLITCYIPYLGAIVSALFAGLVALGAGGVWEAAVVVAVIIFMQNIIDPIITNYKASDELQMNPIVTLVSTLAGGILFGALGAVLGSPIAAIVIRIQSRVKHFGDSKMSVPETGDVVAPNGTSKN